MERLFLTNSLKQAIELNELVLHYQPKLSLKNMTISHVEALVRWHHPEKGLIPPDAFISIAEKTGQMTALTRWVTTTAVRQYVAWREQGLDINVAINISAENIKDKYQEAVESYFNELKLKFPSLDLSYYQSNIEGEIIDKLHEVGFESDGIILNAAAYTHTSVGIGDAVKGIETPVVEVHISNVHAREDFRHHSYIAPSAKGVIFGFGLKGYELAIQSFL